MERAFESRGTHPARLSGELAQDGLIQLPSQIESWSQTLMQRAYGNLGSSECVVGHPETEVS